ncbi:hypothetical protein L917_15843 [Phytophthora nicotianae]|uniref:Uncharacterized protein n=1 Tax=Phytophthora nicotianae TaxID=4792 RepID=W2KGM9_PHYNI|nr:hypothetical protein L917_15843 [Phytophthora nicotianae]
MGSSRRLVERRLLSCSASHAILEISKLFREQHDLGMRHCSVREMTSLWSSAGVLLWKIWRVKKHESRLNRGRLGKRWL